MKTIMTMLPCDQCKSSFADRKCLAGELCVVGERCTLMIRGGRCKNTSLRHLRAVGIQPQLVNPRTICSSIYHPLMI